MEQQYYAIDEHMAKMAKNANSFSEYEYGKATKEYIQKVDTVRALGENQKSRVDSIHHEKIDQLVDRYAKLLANNLNKMYEIDARVPSVMITGGSNFPTEKKEKQNEARDRNFAEWKKTDEIIRQISSVGLGGISSDNPDATQQLQNKLEDLQRLQSQMKDANTYYRKHCTLDGCPALNPTQLLAAKRDMEISWRGENARPFESFTLSNNNAEIRRLKKRIETLQQHKEREYVGWGFDGGYVEPNKEKNRLQIFFDEKPDAEIRSELKSCSFRWSPTENVWQRQLNINAYWACDGMKCVQPLSGESPITLLKQSMITQEVK